MARRIWFAHLPLAIFSHRRPADAHVRLPLQPDAQPEPAHTR
jgi:hypothetical protein